jgi:tRNA(Ile)-lysidine synthase
VCAAEAAPACDAAPVSAAEAQTLFDGLGAAPALILAVSGGPDSTALMVLAADWRGALRQGPELIAATIDHGLRPESAREAHAVKRLAAGLGIRHRILRWTGPKPATGLQAAARTIRYRLLAAAARSAGASHMLTAHTLDDQAETVLFRMARGSGLSGLGAMARETVLVGLPRPASGEIVLLRPLLAVPKARLIATLTARGIAFIDDPSNRDPRFTRTRLRALMPTLAAEGLDANGLARLARRLKRADAALELAVDVAAAAVAQQPRTARGPIVLDAERFLALPAEVALRLLGRGIASTGDEGPVELGKLEALYVALGQGLIDTRSAPAAPRLRRTLAGAVITLAGGRLAIERAPPRAERAKARQRKALTTHKHAERNRSKAR